MKTISDTLRTDPTLPFRRSKNGRFALDLDKREVRRLEPQPFILSAEKDFVRHDSGKVRNFEDVDGACMVSFLQKYSLKLEYNCLGHRLKANIILLNSAVQQCPSCSILLQVLHDRRRLSQASTSSQLQ